MGVAVGTGLTGMDFALARSQALHASRPASVQHRRVSVSAGDDESALVAAAKSGDAQAFEALVTRYEKRIYRLAWNMTQNRSDAEDVVQDAFLKAFQHLDAFQGNSRFYTWLVRIALNECLMKLRRRRYVEIPIDDPVETEDSPIPRELKSWSPSPEESFSQSEIRRFLEGAISELHYRLRVVFQLRDIEQLSIEETAEALGLSVAATKTRLLRARLKLRDKLYKHLRPRSPFQKEAPASSSAADFLISGSHIRAAHA